MLHNQKIVFGGIAVIAFFTVFGTCLSTNNTTSTGDRTLGFQTATPEPSATPTPDPNATPSATGTPAPTATPINRKFGQPPALTIDPAKRYTATIKTDKGDIKVQLVPDKAPQAVNSFVFLANSKYYDGLTFTRVSDFFAQAGDAGAGAPGYTLPVEQNDLTHEPGMVALARSNVDGGLTGQFYVVRKKLANQDGKDTVIGKVISGDDVLSKLTVTDTSQPNAPAGDRILTVTVEEAPAS